MIPDIVQNSVVTLQDHFSHKALSKAPLYVK